MSWDDLFSCSILVVILLSSAFLNNSAPFLDSTSLFGKPREPVNAVWGDWNHYHNYSEIEDTILFLNMTYPDLVEAFSIGSSWLNKTIYCVRLTNEYITPPKPKVLLVGYHHAREPITSELTLYFIVDTVTNYGTDEATARMLDYCEVYVIPALNVDGFDAVKQNEWQRKNVHPYNEDSDGLLDEDPPSDEDGDGYIEDLYFDNGTHYEFLRWEGEDDDDDGLFNEDWIGGVDINRNYAWTPAYSQGSPYPWSEAYRGPAPFSEPETQAIRDLALMHGFEYALSFHSGTFLIISRTVSNPAKNQAYRDVTLNLSAITGAPYSENIGGYPTGYWEDWMYSSGGVVAITCEIYGNNSAWQTEPGPEPNTYWEKGITQFFNPDPDNILSVIQQWAPTCAYIADRSIAEAYDIAATNVTCYKEAVGQGFSTNTSITIENRGSFAENVNVVVYANATPIDSSENLLEAGNTYQRIFSWDTSSFETGTYIITAIVEPLPAEVSLADNARSTTVQVGIPGDVDPIDGYVGIDDIFAIAGHFGLEPGDYNWKATYDVNDDGYVGIDDIFIAAYHFGEETQ